MLGFLDSVNRAKNNLHQGQGLGVSWMDRNGWTCKTLSMKSLNYNETLCYSMCLWVLFICMYYNIYALCFQSVERWSFRGSTRYVSLLFLSSAYVWVCGHNFIHCHHIINDSDTATEYDLDPRHQSFELKLYANHQLKAVSYTHLTLPTSSEV